MFSVSNVKSIGLLFFLTLGFVTPVANGYQTRQIRQSTQQTAAPNNAYFQALHQQNQGQQRQPQGTRTATKPVSGRFIPKTVPQKVAYFDQLYRESQKRTQNGSGQVTRTTFNNQGRGQNHVQYGQNGGYQQNHQRQYAQQNQATDPYHPRHSNVPGRVLYDKQGKPIVLPATCTTGIPESMFQNQQGAATQRPRQQQQPRFASNQSYPTGSRRQQGIEKFQSLDRNGRQNYRNNLRRLVRGEDLPGGNDLRGYEAAPRQNQAGVLPAGFNAAAYNPHSKSTAKNKKNGKGGSDYLNQPGPDPHADVFASDLFPSATKCAKCHQQIFDEWASSSHAYAAVSPMFTRFEDTINRLAQGTIGYFCMRCHTPVGTTLGLRRDQPIWDAPRSVREGVTCVVCHHVKEITLKMNGERRVEPGRLTDPVAGNSDGMGVEAALANANSLKVKIDPNDKRPGQIIHKRAYKFEELSKSTFCIACHQVAVQPGIKLEVVAEQYRASPARRQGITCQDCHMGKVPGANEGYSVGPAAVVDGKAINPLRKHSNHMFFGPGYSIAHPGIFPHDPAQDRWTFNQWLEFDWRAGWGTEQFENDLADGKIHCSFPPDWSNADDRYDAREIVDRNLKKLEYKRHMRRQVLENGSHIDGPFFTKPKMAGQPLEFNYCISNKSSGHNMPSGSLGAQPQLWLNVALIDPDGIRIWESGYLDSNGDLCDIHSLDVLARKVPLDKQLCNFQTKFLTTNVKGTDREMYLPVNFDFDQLPFIRPAAQPVTVINHPPFIRMEGHSIPALGSRKAKYRIPSHLIQKRGRYRLSVRLRSRAEPIYFMLFVKSTPEMIRTMNEWIVDVHSYSYVFDVQ